MIILSLVLPAYMEEENLRLLLPRLVQTLSSLNTVFEIIVVDTEAPLDKTEEVCKFLNVKYVRREGGNTFGAAVRTGIAKAQGQFVIFMDADGSHTPEFIPSLWQHRNTHDLVIASRYVDGGYTENSLALVWMSRILNLSYSLILGLPCKDVSNSFKLYKNSQLKDLDLKCENFDIVEEILFKLIKIHPQIKIKEVPFSFKKRMFGETKRDLLWFMLSYLQTILKLRFMKVEKRVTSTSKHL